MADPGTPGVPQAPIVIYTENAQNRPGPTPIVRLDAYTGATGQAYTAHPNWLSDCNGWIASANQPVDAAAQIADCGGSQATWNRSQQLSWALGLHAGQSQAVAQGNFAVSAFTASNPGAGLVEFETATNIPFAASNRFVSFSVDVSAVNCGVSAPLLQFSLVDDANVATPAGSQVNACTSSATYSVPALGATGAVTINAGTYASNGAVLISGASVGVRMVNNNGSGVGNDHAYDNISILDATPQLDKEFSPTNLLVGQASTLTFTITNTDELGAKNGWSFTDALPAGLTVASGSVSTTCPAGVVTATAGGTSIDVSGNLAAGMASCVATVPVTAASAGTYTNDASNITSSVGVNPPGSTTVTFDAQPSFGVCDATMYLSQNNPTQLFRFDTSSNPFLVAAVGAPAGFQYNATAVSPTDNYQYAMRTPTNTLVRIGGDGSAVELGAVAGLPNTSYNAGEVGPDGTYYVKPNAANATLYRVDIATMTATLVNLSQSINVSDMAWHNGLLYGTAPNAAGPLYAINPVSGAVTALGANGVDGVFGAMYGASNGVFGGNNAGGFYQFDLTTGAATLISNLQGSGNNDGAKCATTAVEFPVDLAITKDNGRDVHAPGDTTYEIVVTNDGPFGVQGALVNDELPTGITEASWTCGAATGGGVCGVASGTGAIADAPVSLPVGASVTFELTMTVPASFAGDLVNTATVTAPVGSPDIDTSDNSATDTDTGQPSFGMCDATMYLAQNQPTGLFEFTTSSNPFLVNPVGPASSITYNAIAMHPTDGYIYGLRGPAPGTVVRVGSDGSVVELGTVAGLPVNSVSGEIGPDGTYYVAASGALYRIDLETMTATSVALSQGIATLDMAWHNGLLYTAVADDSLYAINPANGNVTTVGVTGTTGPFGGMFGASNGVFGSNNNGGFYQFDLTTGAATLISDLPGSGSNDGAKCVTTPLNFPSDLAITKDDGSDTYATGFDTTYTIVVSNDGPFGVQGALVNDPLPAGVSQATWSCGNPTNGGICGVTDGTGPIVDAPVSLPVGASVTFELTIGIPNTYTGPLTNTATVTMPAGSIDPNLDNNEASDTDTQEDEPPVSGACTPVRVGGGGSFALSPFPSNASYSGTGSLTYRPATNSWATSGGNFSWTINFSQPVPAEWLEFRVIDVNTTSDGAAYNPVIQVVANGGATPADFSKTAGDLQYNPATGRLSYTGTPYRQAATLTGNSQDLVSTLQINATNINPADYIALGLWVRPSCVTVQKVSAEATGSFDFTFANVRSENGTTATGTSLTTAEPDTAISSQTYFAMPGTDVVLSETIPDGWALDSAVCTDENAGNTGNPTTVGTFATPAVTIPGGNVRPRSDLQCVFRNVGAAPGLTIEKTGTLNDLDGDNLIDPNETISYSFLVTNSGNVTLTDVTVDDPLLTNAGVSLDQGPQTLAPGGSFTFTATYQPTQDDIDSGSVENTATGTGTPPDPNDPPVESPPDTVTVPPDDASGLTIDKTGTLNDLDGDGLLDLNETITFSFLVTNTGNVTLTDVTVNDPLLINAGVSLDQGPQTLAPGGSFTFTATYQPTQDDIDAGRVENTATGTGTPPDPNDPPVESPPDTVTVPPDDAPGLSIDKTGTLNDVDGDGLIDPGETITYSFLVRNTGNVTLTDVTVNDPLLTDAGLSVTPGPQTLAPGGTATFTAIYQPTQDDIDSGSVQNTATGTGTPPDPNDPPVESPPDTVTVPPDDTPGLTIDKTGALNDVDGDGLIDLGETINYTFLVTNTGNVTLTDVTVNDPLLTNAGLSVTPGPQTLAPGGTATFTATYQPTQDDIDAGRVENTATGTGTPPDPNDPPVESPPDTVTVPPDDATGLTIDKTGELDDLDNDGLIDLGETIRYSFLVTNTGNVTLTDVTVNDPLLTNAGVSLDQGPQTLAPGGSFTFTATYQPTQDDIDAGRVENTATGTGTPPDPNDPPVESPPDTVTVPPDDTPGLSIDKTGTLNDVDGDGLIDPGETITYSFLVRNTGNVTLTGVTVDDPLLTGAGVSLDQGPQTLAPGGSFTFTATYEPTQDDIDSGSVQNTATGTGTPPDPNDPPVESPPDTVTVPPDDTPGLTIDKTGTLNDGDGDGLIDPGETISYSFLVKNTGNVTLTGVTVNDPLLANAGLSVTPGPQTLAPGGTVTFTATYQPTQDDIDAGRVENTATGTGTPPDPNDPPVESPPDTVTVPPDDTPGLTIDKTGTLNDIDGDGLIDPSESISYSFLVKNTGNVTLTDVTVNDPLLTGAGLSVTPGPQTLAPGGTVTFTATYQPTQDDIDAGRVENTATGTGTPPDPNDPPVESPPDTVTVPPDDTPGLSIDKTGTLNDIDGDGLIDPGESISYSFLVRNTGNVTLTGVTVNDPLLTDAGLSVTPGPQTLAPGGTVTFTATYQPTQDDIDAGRVENTATGTGTPPDPNDPPVESPPDTVTVPPDDTPGLTIEKSGVLDDLDNDGLIDLGETITYAFLVTNTGNATLTGVTVDDPLLTDAGVSLDQAPQTLAPGDSFTFTATYQPTQDDIDAGQVENTATGIGTPPDPNDPPVESPPDTITVQLPRADLLIEKQGVLNDVDGNGFANEGDELRYTLIITNTGNVPLADVSPQDPGPTFNGRNAEGVLSAFTPEAVTLQPGEAQAFNATYTLLQGDVENGASIDDGVENTATAIGYANGTRVTGTPVESNKSEATLTLPVPVSDITVTKVANLRFIRRGEQAPFTIKVTNNGVSQASGVTVIDTMPSGFRYVDGSATVNGTEVTPEIAGRQIRFANLSVPGNGGELEIRLRLLALSSAGPGEHVNLASVVGPDGEDLTPPARAVVEIIVEPVFDCGDIIGKVFDDRNGNGYQDKGEPGLPGVRIATVKGWLITTDKYGRFHVACADLPEQRIGSNFIMKLDTRTLPTGFRMTTENPRVVRLTAGKMTELNFGASIGRVVRLDLRDEAFVPGEVELSDVWAAGVDQLIEVLSQERSVLRLSYIDESSDPEFATARIRHIKKLIAERWRQRRREYPLNIEMRVETGQ